MVQTGKALQDQQWLFESLMVQVEERRSAVENTAKQIEDRLVCIQHHIHLWFLCWAEAFKSFFCRLHGVTIAHRKAENQIKMAKMIMMNELNKRANLLIEQLEVITFLSFFPFSFKPSVNRHASESESVIGVM